MRSTWGEGIEHPDVGPADAWGGELGIDRAVLAAVRGRDERAPLLRTGEDDVAGLVSHQERAHHPVRPVAAHVHDTDAVGNVIDHPGLGIRPRHDRDRLQADRDGNPVPEPLRPDVEHLQTAVGGIDREELRAVGRQGEWTDLAALEQRVGRGRRWIGGRS
jgi:hypothetical protein